ncbi:MAG TPA: NAD(P)/FAD-dependent oxidoreductase [Candidatus Sulfotelmatobacter sp.]|nr:NAD(P)/FAD-dependent oxidoreductase [Candidatus Sulfotelmatobacter sp.]
MRADVLVIGAGPAGIATAIAARLKGLRVTVADARRPPIDKPCGEGLLPEAVRSLRQLGIDLNQCSAFPLGGICFTDESSTASAVIPKRTAFGIRRTALHQLLIERALELGVSFHWGAQVTQHDPGCVRINGNLANYDWLVGADGLHSRVREWAGLNPRRKNHSRFGFRRHFELEPWTDIVQVYWGRRFELVVTPVSPAEVCVSFFTSDPTLRIDAGLAQFPSLAARFKHARALNSERGTVTSLLRPRAVCRGRLALVGDASCAVDGIAGQGMSLALQQALALAGALAGGNLNQYQAAHREICRIPVRLTRLLLAMDRSAWIRRKVLSLFAAMPPLFAKAIALHTNEPGRELFAAKDFFHLGWSFLHTR